MNAPGRKGPVDLVLDSTGLKFYGPGEWARKMHGEKRRSWRKLHIAMDAGTGEILAHELTNDDTSDNEMVTPLIENAGGRIRRVYAPSHALQAKHCRAMDGALGFWAALREVFGSTAEQRCWLHKTGNVLKGAIGSSPMDDAEIRAGQSQRPPT